jgi:branched-chain amino acid transport system substrate-binding protein
MHDIKKYILLVYIVFSFFIVGCRQQVIEIGFIGDLTSKSSQLSIDARNGVELGVKIINETGGVNGKKIKLVVKDNGLNNDVAIKAHTEFMKQGIKLVIGPQTSALTDAVIESQSKNLLFLSPSMSTDRLNNMDDFFLRIASNGSSQGDYFHKIMVQQTIQRVTVVYDTINLDYAQGVYERINDLNAINENYTLTPVPFHSQTDNLTAVANTVINSRSQAVLLISQAIDSAILVQHIKKQAPETMLYSVSWSMTKDFIENSGKAGEGVSFIGPYIAASPSAKKQAFIDQYEADYGYTPTFIAIRGYDTIMALMEGIKEAKSFEPDAVKEAIISIGSFNGLETDYQINAYGDATVPYFLYELKHGEFVHKRIE